MGIEVEKNPDGGYTVRCEDEVVIIPGPDGSGGKGKGGPPIGGSGDDIPIELWPGGAGGSIKSITSPSGGFDIVSSSDINQLLDLINSKKFRNSKTPRSIFMQLNKYESINIGDIDKILRDTDVDEELLSSVIIGSAVVRK